MNVRDSRTPSLPEWFTPERAETVVVAFPDAFGRLLGKRITHDHFVNHVLGAGMHVCNYLLTSDIEMNVLSGFDLASWEKGFGDFVMNPDPSTARRLPWHERTCLVLGDLVDESGAAIRQAPRSVLAHQLERLAEIEVTALVGSELEFVLFEEPFDASRTPEPTPTPTSAYSIDYHILQPGRHEHVLRRLRAEMGQAGIPVEGTKGEAALGQHELNLVHSEAMEMADRHVVYKLGAKEIAVQEGRAITFMSKWAANQPGNGFHLHISLWDEARDRNLFWDDEAGAASDVFWHFLGGLLDHGRDLAYFFAPTINSYKRFQPGSWAPTAVVCGDDNRTCGLRIVGEGRSLRIENRMAGADANPYLAFAATVAAGLDGVEKQRKGEVFSGNAYADESLPRLPTTLEGAANLLDDSTFARNAFGPDVVDFYVRLARAEWAAYRSIVTPWERRRYLEQV